MGWNKVINTFGVPAGNFDVTVFESRSLSAGVFPVSATWPCDFINQVTMVALRGSPSLVQKFGNVAPAGAFTTWTITFPANNTGGNTLILDLAFQSTIYVAGPVTVTDSQGNIWTREAAGIPPFQAFFQQCWVAAGCASGANTVTITIGGGYHFLNLTAVVTEYRGITGMVDAATYATGPVFGTGQPVTASLTVTGGDLLHLVTSTNQHCPGGVAVTGGGYSDCFAAWLVILEPA